MMIYIFKYCKITLIIAFEKAYWAILIRKLKLYFLQYLYETILYKIFYV